MTNSIINTYIFRPAEETDIESIMQIIYEAQINLRELKVDQWQDGYPNLVIIKNDIENKTAYVLEQNNRVYAYSAIIFNKEKTYEKIYSGKWLSNGEFVVAHRLAVANNKLKSGLATILLQHIENLAKSNNIFSFKVDTHEDNLPMNNLLKKNGFKYCGIIYLENGKKRLAYEKIIKNK